MSRYWSDFPSYSQPSVNELRMKAASSVANARKKGRTMDPAIPQKNTGPICQSWWGQAWCENLERYADFSTRLARGARYIRSGTVLDLKISRGRIEARVQGRRKIPYKIDIRISPLSEDKCQRILEKCGRRIRNMEELIYGRFPEDLKVLFSAEDGLFPTPAEISFICNCPDWALMCKHVAAAMYGIGLRLDENPFYFFELRGIDVDRFIDVALESKAESMLDHADVITDRMILDEDMLSVFDMMEISQTTFPTREAASTPPADTGETTPEHSKPSTTPQIYIQSMDGHETSTQLVISRVLSSIPDADHIYVKPEENRAYWTAKERNGFITLW